jgi:hypothetical protein
VDARKGSASGETNILLDKPMLSFVVKLSVFRLKRALNP